jgi:hypothetical protein
MKPDSLKERSLRSWKNSLTPSYGAITPQTLAAAKAEVKAKSYILARPIVNIFAAINND